LTTVQGSPWKTGNGYFDPFESSALSSGASGLGLAIVARFVEAMSGRVFISDTLGGGTTMTIHLPATVGIDLLATETPYAENERAT
jgi:K+-sensing histidine kinase KdpD